MIGAYVALLVGAIAAGLVSRNKRDTIWLLLFQAAFWLPVLYWDFHHWFGAPLPMLFGVICDALVVHALYVYGRERWEEWCMTVYVLSILTTIAILATMVFQPEFNLRFFDWAKYALNWAAIFIVGGVSAFRNFGYDNTRASANWTHFLGRERAFARQAKTTQDQ